jgi:hypothetical protein
MRAARAGRGALVVVMAPADRGDLCNPPSIDGINFRLHGESISKGCSPS